MACTSSFWTRADSLALAETPCGVCFECYSTVFPKTGENGTLEYFCSDCASSRRFCVHPECFFLIETFYSDCGCPKHYKVWRTRGASALPHPTE